MIPTRRQQLPLYSIIYAGSNLVLLLATAALDLLLRLVR